jgi:hypothetical protein
MRQRDKAHPDHSEETGFVSIFKTRKEQFKIYQLVKTAQLNLVSCRRMMDIKHQKQV